MSFFVSDTAYDKFMGRYSTRLAAPFAEFAGITRGMQVADVGAGTGALTRELCERGAHVAAADPSPPFVEALQERFPDVESHVAPAEHLPWDNASFDATLAQLVVPFMDDAPAGVAEMRRVTKPGGTVAVCAWSDDGMEMLAAIGRAQQALGSGSAAMPENRQMYRKRDAIESLFAEGYSDLETELLEVESSYTGFDEFFDALLGGAGPAGQWVASLEGDAREQARAELFRQLGEPDGEFRLVGRAWATRARRT